MMVEPGGLGCFDCGVLYGGPSWVEAVIPDDDWLAISPTGNFGGILCIGCMAARLIRAGRHRVPVWLCGMEPFEAQAGDPGRSPILRNARTRYGGGYIEPSRAALREE